MVLEPVSGADGRAGQIAGIKPSRPFLILRVNIRFRGRKAGALPMLARVSLPTFPIASIFSRGTSQLEEQRKEQPRSHSKVSVAARQRSSKSAFDPLRTLAKKYS
jgi:hypothetical protein